MTKSNIEWTEQTWNPIVGCSIVSPGCTNCYAMTMARRIDAMHAALPPSQRPAREYEGTTKVVNGKAVWTGKVTLARDDKLLQPLRRRKSTTYFVNSMGDLFHEAVPEEWIDRVFAVMALTPQHTFQVLTKRAERMREYLCNSTTRRRIYELVCDMAVELRLDVVLIAAPKHDAAAPAGPRIRLDTWPLPNVWLGVSAEDQRRADERIPRLLATPAKVRFVSAEPLLGPIDLTRIKLQGIVDPFDAFAGATWSQPPSLGGARFFSHSIAREDRGKIDQVIVGGESGPSARPMHPDWARSLRDQCADAGAAFFFKQWGEFHPHDSDVGMYEGPHDGEWPSVFVGTGDRNRLMLRVGKKRAGRLLDGVVHDGRP